MRRTANDKPTSKVDDGSRLSNIPSVMAYSSVALSRVHLPMHRKRNNRNTSKNPLDNVRQRHGVRLVDVFPLDDSDDFLCKVWVIY